MRISKDTIDLLASLQDLQAIKAQESYDAITRWVSDETEISSNWTLFNTRITERFNHPDFYQTIGWFWLSLIQIKKKTIHLKVLP